MSGHPPALRAGSGSGSGSPRVTHAAMRDLTAPQLLHRARLELEAFEQDGTPAHLHNAADLCRFAATRSTRPVARIQRPRVRLEHPFLPIRPGDGE